MGLFGSKPKKVRPSAQEKAEAAFAGYRQNIDQQFGSPLRVQQIEEARDAQKEANEYGFFSSKSNADIKQAEQGAFQKTLRNAAISGQGIQNLRDETEDNSLILAEAGSEGKQDAFDYAQLRGDERILNATKVGEALASTTQNTLGSLASSERNFALSKLKSEQLESSSKAKALGDVIMSAGTIGAAAYDKYKNKKKDPAISMTGDTRYRETTSAPTPTTPMTLNDNTGIWKRGN